MNRKYYNFKQVMITKGCFIMLLQNKDIFLHIGLYTCTRWYHIIYYQDYVYLFYYFMCFIPCNYCTLVLFLYYEKVAEIKWTELNWIELNWGELN